MTPDQSRALASRWRAQADSKDAAAAGYNRKCIAVKGVQLILLAKQLRKCADEVEAIENGAGEAEATSGDADTKASGE